MWNLIRNVMPFKVFQVVVVQAYEPHKQCLMDYLGYQAARVHSFSVQRPVVHVAGQSVSDTVQQLQSRCGISPAVIPASFGGRLNYDAALHNWTRMRLGLEDIMASSSPNAWQVVPHDLLAHVVGGRNNRCSPGFASTTTTGGGALVVATPRLRGRGSGSSLDTNNSNKRNHPLTLEERRKRQALYSRRTYHRRKITTVSLQEQIRQLQRSNEVARTESQRLENLISMAQSMIVLELQQQQQSCFQQQQESSSFTNTFFSHWHVPTPVQEQPLSFVVEDVSCGWGTPPPS